MTPPECLRSALRYDGEHLWWKDPKPPRKAGPAGTLVTSNSGKQYLRICYT